MIRVTDRSFASATKGAPTLVSFSMPNRCPKCVTQKPVLGEVSALGYPVALVDAEQEDSRQLFKLGSGGDSRIRVPVHHVFAGGRKIATLKGLRSKEELVAFAKENGVDRAPVLQLGGWSGDAVASFGRTISAKKEGL